MKFAMAVRCAALGALVLITVPLPAKAEYTAGVLAALRGDHDTAYRELLRPAELGVTDAQFLLAALCDSLAGTISCGQVEAYVWYSIALPRLDTTTAGRASMIKGRLDFLRKSLSRGEASFAERAIKEWAPARHIDFTKLPRRPPPPEQKPEDGNILP